jgi:hypothetical protein
VHDFTFDIAGTELVRSDGVGGEVFGTVIVR